MRRYFEVITQLAIDRMILNKERLLSTSFFLQSMESQEPIELIERLAMLDKYTLYVYSIIARLQCQYQEIGRRPIQVEEILTDLDKVTNFIQTQVCKPSHTCPIHSIYTLFLYI
jgi:hypothetical protein